MEIWKAIEGTDGKYEVSNTGKVRSRNYNHRQETRELKQKTDRYGYSVIHYSVNGKRIYTTVHRLVAKAFIPNTENLPAVNHKDANKKNNHVSNLEWVTNKGNSHHALQNGLLDNLFTQRDKAMEEIKKPIVAVNIETGEETHYDSQNAARKALKIAAHKVVNGHLTQSNGFVFYEPCGDNAENQRRKDAALKLAITKGGKGANKRKPVIAINLLTGEKHWYKSAAEARDTLPNRPCVYDVLSGKITKSKGYTFVYAESEEVVP